MKMVVRGVVDWYGRNVTTPSLPMKFQYGGRFGPKLHESSG
jgi:hypothetical protein